MLWDRLGRIWFGRPVRGLPNRNVQQVSMPSLISGKYKEKRKLCTLQQGPPCLFYVLYSATFLNGSIIVLLQGILVVPSTAKKGIIPWSQFK